MKKQKKQEEVYAVETECEQPVFTEDMFNFVERDENAAEKMYDKRKGRRWRQFIAF